MMNIKSITIVVILMFLGLSQAIETQGADAQKAQTAPSTALADLAGTSWQLVKIQGMDDTTVVPDDRSKYTIAFESDGTVNVLFDCNRGHGTWKSSGPNQLEFGTMATTLMMCPPGSLDNRLARDWPNVRSYTMKDGHLYLSLMADGGIYEYEPMNAPQSNLGGTSWQLVKIQGIDGKAVVPDDKAKYTIAFGDHGMVNARIDCNRGHGTWKSAEAGKLELGPLATTRAMCPPGSLYDRVVKDWASVRAYSIKNGHLFLSLANGAFHEYEPTQNLAP
jgi:heat shock protein HslJ